MLWTMVIVGVLSVALFGAGLVVVFGGYIQN